MTIKVYKEIDSEWDCVQTIVGHTDTVWAVDWSPDGKRIASVGSDNWLVMSYLADFYGILA